MNGPDEQERCKREAVIMDLKMATSLAPSALLFATAFHLGIARPREARVSFYRESVQADPLWAEWRIQAAFFACDRLVFHATAPRTGNCKLINARLSFTIKRRRRRIGSRVLLIYHNARLFLLGKFCGKSCTLVESLCFCLRILKLKIAVDCVKIVINTREIVSGCYGTLCWIIYDISRWIIKIINSKGIII